MDPKQLGRPILEASRIECPATHMGKPLALRKVELCLFEFVNLEIHPYPIQESAIARPEGFGTSDEPAVGPFGVTNSESKSTGGAGAHTG